MKKLLLTICVSLFVFTGCGKSQKTSENFMSENQNVRLENFFNKIRNKQNVTVVCMGGSITSGYNANPIKTASWAGQTEAWLNNLTAENKSSMTFFNMGMGGTDSAFGVARVDDHIINKNPDLVILEFAMNDQWLDPAVRQRTYESIIRKILSKTDAAVLALFVNERKAPYSSNQAEQQKICEYYHVPFVSWKDSLFEENPSADFEGFFDGTETIHPSNAGHASIAGYITKTLNQVWENLPAEKNILLPVKELPLPLTDCGYENVKYYTSDNTVPVENDGWEADSPVHDEWQRYGSSHKGWQTKEQMAEMVIEVEGSSVGVTYCESDQFQDAVIWVCDEEDNDLCLTELKNYVSYRNGYYGWFYRELIHGDEIKKYRVHVGVYDMFGDNEEGKYTNITGILCAQ
ncbi:MAG: SGNH/GDSL hydrolase family protein [Treponema sp.]|nr:SGNH/GDSL hydrolase family protein [Treponema sp.]